MSRNDRSRTTGSEFKENQLPTLEEFNGLRPGDTVTWVDAEARNQFNIPAFNHGDGPFKIISIRKVRQKVLLEIQTPQDTVFISSDFFKKSD